MSEAPELWIGMARMIRACCFALLSCALGCAGTSPAPFDGGAGVGQGGSNVASGAGGGGAASAGRATQNPGGTSGAPANGAVAGEGSGGTGTGGLDVGGAATAGAAGWDDGPPVLPVHGEPFDSETDCETYCSMLDSACLGDEVSEQYRGHRECVAVCELKTPGGMDDTSGDTMGCRLNRAKAAAAASAADRPALCASAGPLGGGVCGSVCEGYCAIALPVCRDAPPERSGHVDWPSCMAACTGMLDRPEPYHWGGNMYYGSSVQCRTAHAANQADDIYASGGEQTVFFHCAQARALPLNTCL